MIRRYIIVKKKLSHESEEKDNGKNEFWENEGYHEYIENHGSHFSDKLAEWASKKMKNSNGIDHTWSIDDVKGAFTAMGYKLPVDYTWGDATYLANFLYSDLAACLKTDTEAVKMAYTIMSSDADGYVGMIFNRWTSDIMTKNEHVDWKSVM